ncbi:MAG: hypothetical protein ACK4TG_12400, partial [Thermaurantiacus sp.]
ANAAVARDWLPKLTARAYDPRLVPWHEKAGVTMGMGMTEKQGGSDVRANTTRARPDGHDRNQPGGRLRPRRTTGRNPGGWRQGGPRGSRSVAGKPRRHGRLLP